MTPLDRAAPVYVAGHRGLVGSAIERHLRSAGFTNLLTRTSADLDLRDRDATFGFLESTRPRVVVLAAARVGGIMANATEPVEFLSDNLRIQLSVIDGAHSVGVERLFFLGSSCIYPKYAPQPIREESMLTGALEPTNDAYAIAKIAGVMHVQAMRRQYGHRWISAMPTNLYGPGDSFDLARSHVLPALIRRFHDARVAGAERVVLWGTGTPRREFLHVDDLARASLLLLESYDDDVPINVGTGADLPISQLAVEVARVVGFEGVIDFDADKPDGTPRKLLDVSRLNALGFEPRIDLAEGLRSTYAWYLENVAPENVSSRADRTVDVGGGA